MLNFVTMSNFMAVSQIVAEILCLGFFKLAADAILGGFNCIIVPNFVEIALTAAEMWRFFILDFRNL